MALNGRYLFGNWINVSNLYNFNLPSVALTCESDLLWKIALDASKK